jgi:hypothetical protein
MNCAKRKKKEPPVESYEKSVSYEMAKIEIESETKRKEKAIIPLQYTLSFSSRLLVC